MKTSQAITFSLAELPDSIVTRYTLGLIIHKLYRQKEYQGETLNIKRDYATSAQFSKHLEDLTKNGILKPLPHFTQDAFRILGRKENTPDEIACLLDPFCYVSHLSAMAYHGLTNRIPDRLFLTSLPRHLWNQEAAKKMQSDLGDELSAYTENGLPTLTKTRLARIDKTDIHETRTSKRGSYLKITDRPLRVSKIGHTFLEMIRYPRLCGGLRHVIEVFEEYGEKYLPLIVNELDRNGTAIDKVRVGYILEERMKIRNETVDGWTSLAQRGGSRKLDAEADYHHVWSEKWMLSLNLN